MTAAGKERTAIPSGEVVLLLCIYLHTWKENKKGELGLSFETVVLKMAAFS